MRRLVHILMLILLPLAGCSPKAGGGSGGGSPSVVKVFSRSDGSMLYFAGPLEYKNQEGGDQILLDFTLNKLPNEAGEVVCNFTLISADKATFKPTSLKLVNDQLEASAGGFDLLFAERKGKHYRYRYGASFQTDQWLSWAESENGAVLLNDTSFKPQRKTRKHMREVNDRIIFQLRQEGR